MRSIRSLWTRGGATYDLPIERSAEARYRFTLTRDLVSGPRSRGSVLFVMLNPSTATHLKDDPTIRRCISFAHDWLFSRLVICNLFAWRETDPKLLTRVADPTGDPMNENAILVDALRADLVVCAWGKGGRLRGRGDYIATRLREAKCDPHYLRLLDDGEPEHPLYLPRSLRPQPWTIGEPA